MCYVHNQWYDISCDTLYVWVSFDAKCNFLLQQPNDVTQNQLILDTKYKISTKYVKLFVATSQFWHHSYQIFRINTFHSFCWEDYGVRPVTSPPVMAVSVTHSTLCSLQTSVLRLP